MRTIKQGLTKFNTVNCLPGLLMMTVLSLSSLLPGVAQAKEGLQLNISLPDTNRASTAIAQKVLTRAYGQLGIKANFIATPGVRALSMWNDDRLDAIAARLTDTPLPNAVKVNIPIVVEEAVVFTTKKNFTVDGFDSLKPYVVGYVSGVPYLDERLKNVPQKELAPGLESLFRKLDAGRTDVAVDSRFSLCLVRKLGLNHIHVLEPSLDKRLGYHFLHIKHQPLLPLLEAVLKNMEKDGSIKKIQDETMQEYMEQCTGLSDANSKKAATL